MKLKEVQIQNLNQKWKYFYLSSSVCSDEETFTECSLNSYKQEGKHKCGLLEIKSFCLCFISFGEQKCFILWLKHMFVLKTFLWSWWMSISVFYFLWMHQWECLATVCTYMAPFNCPGMSCRTAADSQQQLSSCQHYGWIHATGNGWLMKCYVKGYWWHCIMATLLLSLCWRIFTSSPPREKNSSHVEQQKILPVGIKTIRFKLLVWKTINVLLIVCVIIFYV